MKISSPSAAVALFDFARYCDHVSFFMEATLCWTLTAVRGVRTLKFDM